VNFRQALLFPENLVQRNPPKHQWKREPRLIERLVFGRQFGIPTDRSWPIALAQHNAANLSDANSASFAADSFSGLE
jgi:hypothetical protein